MLADLPTLAPSILVSLTLGALAIVVWRARPGDRANRAFTLLIALIAANYAFVAASEVALDPAEGRVGLSLVLMQVAFALEILEPAALMGFVLAYPGRADTSYAWAKRATWAISIAMELLPILDPQLIADANRPTRLMIEAYITVAYVGALVAFLLREAQRAEGQRPVYPAGFLLAWSVVVVLRVGFEINRWLPFQGAYVARTTTKVGGSLASGLGELTLALLLLGALGALAARRASPPNRKQLLRVLLGSTAATTALWAVVHLTQILAVALNDGVRFAAERFLGDVDALLHRGKYASRWLFFAAIAGPAFLRNQIFDIEPRLRRALVAAVATGAFLLAFLVGLAALAPVVELRGSAWAHVVVALLVVTLVGSQSVRLGRRVAERAFPSARDRDEAYRRMRRIEIYRDAHVAVAEGRASRADLDALRSSLGLGPEDARAATAFAPARVFIEPGTLVARRYKITAPLGRGGSGRVWRAVDGRDAQEVALKVIDDPLARGADVDHEVAVARRLRHPRILPVLDHGYADGAAYLVTPIAPGGSLADLLAREGNLPAERACRIALDVLDALSAAHRAGIVHRDLKPSNVMLDGEGRALVADFGVAVVTDPSRTATSVLDPRVAGTLAYLPPEALDGDPPTPAWDVYAAGTLLSEMLLGRAPRAGEAPPPTTPLALASAIAKARADEPAQRYANASEMLEALKDRSQHLPRVDRSSTR